MRQDKPPIVGIDLGTTNSVVAAWLDGKVQVIREAGLAILPSVVGITLDDKLVVGQTAKNQLIAFPERTVASVKRRMGQAIQLTMADQTYSPQEISAMILRRLRQRAEQALGTEVTRAVITVPAFFDENQRQATREAGQLAGLAVERIINEPTAASLVYHAASPERRHLIVYDLGGGTFDVSIVRIEAGVVEVLSSRGDTQLGGDDFDQLLTQHVANQFLDEYDQDLMSQPSTRWHLMQACERAKCELSSVSNARIAEEFLGTADGNAVNLDVEVTRLEYEQLISPLVERTIECVNEAIRDSCVSLSQLDELILVGGSTRTPLVQRRLREELQREPQWCVDPDLAVALGAATQAALQDGSTVGPVLIDVATHTLGIEALTGSVYPPQIGFCPIIHRNSPLPAKYEEAFQTVMPDQRAADILVYQGESKQLHQNRLLGRFLLEGLNASDDADGEVDVCFELTLDGVLKVTATEHRTGRSKTLTVDNALARMGRDAGQDAKQRLHSLFDGSDDFEKLASQARRAAETDTEDAPPSQPLSSQPPVTTRVDEPSQPASKLQQLLARARSLKPSLGADDAADVERLIDLILNAEREGDEVLLPELEAELDDLLFYVAD
jgi:molecular chaperone DnaK